MTGLMRHAACLCLMVAYAAFGMLLQRAGVIHHPAWWSCYGFVDGAAYASYVVRG
jgi:hypothetical protein